MRMALLHHNFNRHWGSAEFCQIPSSKVSGVVLVTTSILLATSIWFSDPVQHSNSVQRHFGACILVGHCILSLRCWQRCAAVASSCNAATGNAPGCNAVHSIATSGMCTCVSPITACLSAAPPYKSAHMLLTSSQLLYNHAAAASRPFALDRPGSWVLILALRAVHA